MILAATPKSSYAGATSSTGVFYLDRRNFYLKPNQFAELFPNVAPFITYTMKANFRSGLQDPVFKLFQHKAPWERQVLTGSTALTIGAAATGTATESEAVTFTSSVGLKVSSGTTPYIDGSYLGLVFEIWDSTGVTKRGVVLLTDDTTTSSASFTNLGETAITTVSGDLFVCIGNAREEGVVSPEAWADELEVVWNQAQIFRTPIEITGSLAQQSLKGANKELARLRADKMAEHKIQMEKAFLYGESPLGTNLAGTDTFTNLDKLMSTSGVSDTSRVVRTTVGLVRALELYGATSGDYQSVFSFAAASAEYGDLVDSLEKVFQYVPMSGMKDSFLGSGALGFWSKRAMEKNSGWVINVNTENKNVAGQNVRTLVTPHGDLILILTHSMKYEH